MATQEMKIKIGADVSQGVAGVNAFNKSLTQLPVAGQKATKAFSDVRNSANAANVALLNAGRIAQDAPFGFIGFANNLNPFFDSLRAVIAQAGSATAALKALGSAVLGVGGIGLALSIFQFFALSKAMGSTGEAAKTAKDEIDDLLKTVKGAKDATFAGIGSAQGDIQQVRALAAAVQDETRSEQERARALEQLKELNKAYFGDLKLQEDSLRKLNPLVREYTDAIIQQAIVSELSSEIGKVGAAFVKQVKAVRDAKDALNAYKESLNIPAVDSAGNRVFILDKNIDALTQSLKKQQDLLKPIEQKYSDLSSSLEDATLATLKFKSTKGVNEKEVDSLSKMLSVLEKIRDINSDKLGKLFDLSDIAPAVKELEKLENKITDLKIQVAVRDARKAKLPQAQIDQLAEGIREDGKKRLNDLFQKEALLLEPRVEIKPQFVQRVEITQNINDLISKATGFDKKIPEITIQQARLKILGFEKGSFVNEIEKQLEAAQQRLREIPFEFKVRLNTEAFTDLSESIGESFAGLLNGEGIGNVLINAAQSFLGVIGNVLSEVGKQIIATSVLIKALKKALAGAFTNPAAALGIGIALVSAGALLKNIKLPGFAEGGIAKGPKSGYPVILHGEEMIIPMNKIGRANTGGISGLGSVQFAPISITIPGQQLRILLDRVDRSNGRLF